MQTGRRSPLILAACMVRLLLISLMALVGCSGSKAELTLSSSSGQATILVFSDLRGALKPCGCSPDLRRGGVDRITRFVQTVRKTTPEAVLLHSGNLFVDDEGVPKDRAKQVTRRILAMTEAVLWMNASAVTLGPYDMAQGLDWLESQVKDLKLPLVVTNVEGARWRAFSKEWIVLDAGGTRIGVIGLVPKGSEGTTDPLSAARRAVAALRSERVDVVVALSSLGLRNAKRLLRKKPGIDILHAGGQDLKALVTDEVVRVGAGWLLQSFVQGGQIGRIQLRAGTKGLQYVEPGKAAPKAVASFRYGLTPIGWDLPQDPKALAIMTAYDKDLKAINLASVGSLPALKPGQASYVGAEKCFECHEETQPFWEKDRHRTAWDTLVKDGKTFDLDCVSCHATGYGKAGGSILGAMKNLKTVQCESCHGPGSIHAEDGEVETITREVPASLCVGCHNEKHSTGFDYQKYRSRLLVPGHGH